MALHTITRRRRDGDQWPLGWSHVCAGLTHVGASQFVVSWILLVILQSPSPGAALCVHLFMFHEAGYKCSWSFSTRVARPCWGLPASRMGQHVLGSCTMGKKPTNFLYPTYASPFFKHIVASSVSTCTISSALTLSSHSNGSACPPPCSPAARGSAGRSVE